MPVLVLALALVSVVAPALANPVQMCDAPPCSRRELKRYEQRVVRHLLRAQQARSEARARGDEKQVKRYEREFQRTRERRQEVRNAIERAYD
jgi:hypothetical protein